MSKKIRLVCVALVVFVVVLMAFAGTALASYNFTTHTADKSQVVSSPHNVAGPGENPCESCHIPHDANGDFLWARNPSTSTAGSGVVTANDDTGVSSDIKPMCYSCHDGGVASVGLLTTFSATHTNHRTRAASSITSAPGVTPVTYRGPGRDCDLCHDPHDDGNSKFLKYERYTTHAYPAGWYSINKGGNVCASCHTGNVDGAIVDANGTKVMNHPTMVTPGVPLVANTVANSHWPTILGWNLAVPINGTRLFDATSRLVSTNTNAVVMCESCHTPHGAEPAAIYVTNQTTGDTAHSLNTMATNQGQLCLNCH